MAIKCVLKREIGEEVCTKANNAYEKNFFKLMNNIVFGEALEGVGKYKKLIGVNKKRGSQSRGRREKK